MSNIVTVNFRNDTLFAVERDDGVFVAIKPICDSLGINWRKQREKIEADTILSEGCTLAVTPTPGGRQEMFCLKLDLVNGWLLGIDDRRIPDPEVREKVLVYKRECYRVLFDHFYGRPKHATVIEPPEQTEEAEGPRVRMVTEARHTFGTQAAAQLWFKLGLPLVPAMYHDPRQMVIDYSTVKPAQPASEAG